MMKIVEIKKSWKKEGFAEVKANNGKIYLRRIYEKREGLERPSINLDAEIISFDWEGTYGINFKYEHSYSRKGMKISESIKEEVEEREIIIPEVIKDIEKIEDGIIRHQKYNQIKTCIDMDIPVYLVGPAGSGKNHTLEQIAKDLDLEFYFTNSIQQEYKITGFIDAGGVYHETEFYKAFKDGGLFFLDEMDASIPEVLVLLNAAIANKYFEFPNGKIYAHEDFRVVAAGNTVGSGADEMYTGRLVLDQATLDRFAIIEFDYDEKIEIHLAKGNMDLVKFIHSLRKQSADKGIRATFSYRCISMVTKLEGKLVLEDIMTMVIFKGMDKDTINTFRTEVYNRYTDSMKKVQR